MPPRPRSSSPKIDGLVVTEMEDKQLLQIARLCAAELAYRAKVAFPEGPEQFRRQLLPPEMVSFVCHDEDEEVPGLHLTGFGVGYEALRGTVR